MELHSSTPTVIGVIPPETTHSFLVVDDRSIDIRISSLTGRITITTGTALPELHREEPGRTLGAIHVLPLVRDEMHSQVNSISPRGLVHLIIQFSGDSTAKKPAGLSPMNSSMNDQFGSHAVRFTTTEESINVLFDLCPLN